MEREEFIKSLGLGLALICTGTCFQACKKGGDEGDPGPGPGGGNNTVSVSLSQLPSVGSQTTSGSVLFIRIAETNEPASFVATERLCPHQGGNLIWQQANNRLQCDLHTSRYSSNGAVLQQPQDGGSTRALKIYAVTVSGNTLTATVA